MAAKKTRAPRPLDAALTRLLALAAKAVAPTRMAREVEVIVAEWQRDEPELARDRVDELREQLMAGVADAEEQASDADSSDAGAVKQAALTLAALQATHEAAVTALRTM